MLSCFIHAYPIHAKSALGSGELGRRSLEAGWSFQFLVYQNLPVYSHPSTSPQHACERQRPLLRQKAWVERKRIRVSSQILLRELCAFRGGMGAKQMQSPVPYPSPIVKATSKVVIDSFLSSRMYQKCTSTCRWGAFRMCSQSMAH